MSVNLYLHPSFLSAKIRGRGFCCLSEGAVLHLEGRILNNQPSAAIRIGKKSQVRGELFTFGHGGQIILGQSCYVGSGTKIWSGERVTIGDFVLIAHNVSIMDNLTHPIDHLKRRQQFADIGSSGHPPDIDLNDKPVSIGDDVWIGANSIIMRGVKIGSRSIISAGSIVKEDVLSDTIVAGNPAKVIRKLPQ